MQVTAKVDRSSNADRTNINFFPHRSNSVHRSRQPHPPSVTTQFSQNLGRHNTSSIYSQMNQDLRSKEQTSYCPVYRYLHSSTPIYHLHVSEHLRQRFFYEITFLRHQAFSHQPNKLSAGCQNAILLIHGCNSPKKKCKVARNQQGPGSHGQLLPRPSGATLNHYLMYKP